MKRLQKFEELEKREVLHGSVVGSLSPYMTLSFVGDGVAVSSEQNALYETFSKVAEPDEWKAVIQDSFNKWAIHTNSDIGVVSDSGDPLGTLGRRQSDDRFGDIRIAAISLHPSVYAISFPRDNVSIGTWAADIVFNADAEWNSLEDIASVALHEAGHIYGVEHSDDPSDAMYLHGLSNITELSANDIAAIQGLYGKRTPDFNEGEQGNNSLEFASDLSGNFQEDGLVVGYGDISELGDIDFFELGAEFSIEENLAIRIQSDGISLLQPTVSFYTVDQELILTTEAEGGVVVIGGDVQLNDAAYFSVGASEDGFGIGRYSYAFVPDQELFLDERFADFAGGELYEHDLEDFDLPGFFTGEPFFGFEPGPFEEPFLASKTWSSL